VEKWLADNEVFDPEGPSEMFEKLTQRRLLRGLRRRSPAFDPPAQGSREIVHDRQQAEQAMRARRTSLHTFPSPRTQRPPSVLTRVGLVSRQSALFKSTT